MTVDAFIKRYKDTEASERGAAQMFLGDLCDVLDVPAQIPRGPRPARTSTSSSAAWTTPIRPTVQAVMTHADEPLTV